MKHSLPGHISSELLSRGYHTHPSVRFRGYDFEFKCSKKFIDPITTKPKGFWCPKRIMGSITNNRHYSDLVSFNVSVRASTPTHQHFLQIIVDVNKPWILDNRTTPSWMFFVVTIEDTKNKWMDVFSSGSNKQGIFQSIYDVISYDYIDGHYHMLLFKLLGSTGRNNSRQVTTVKFRVQVAPKIWQQV